jgi:hypothetical protein
VRLHKRTKLLLSWLAGVALAALMLAPLPIAGMSAVTKGLMIGLAGAVCLVAIGLGAWNARCGEQRRRDKEYVWNHH